MRVKLLGEDLVAFRDTQGRVGLLDEHCPHRLASLFFGRNEEDGLRCVYHGWKFDVDGQLRRHADRAGRQPLQGPGAPCPPIQRSRSGGVIWTYMGPPAKQPAPPDDGVDCALQRRTATSPRRYEYCNYLQGIEGGIDTAHSSFLHNNNLADRGSFRQMDTAAAASKSSAPITASATRASATCGDDGHYVRIYQFVLPFHQFRAPHDAARRGSGRAAIPQVRGHMWVPMDD